MSMDTEILLTAFCLLRLRVILFGEIRCYKSPIRIRIKSSRLDHYNICVYIDRSMDTDLSLLRQVQRKTELYVPLTATVKTAKTSSVSHLLP